MLIAMSPNGLELSVGPIEAANPSHPEAITTRQTLGNGEHKAPFHSSTPNQPWVEVIRRSKRIPTAQPSTATPMDLTPSTLHCRKGLTPPLLRQRYPPAHLRHG